MNNKYRLVISTKNWFFSYTIQKDLFFFWYSILHYDNVTQAMEDLKYLEEIKK